MKSVLTSVEKNPLRIEIPQSPKPTITSRAGSPRLHRLFQPAMPTAITNLYTPTPPSTKKTKTTSGFTEMVASIHVRDAFISSELDKLPPLPRSLHKQDPYDQVIKKLEDLFKIYLKTERDFDTGYKKGLSRALKTVFRLELMDINTKLISLLNEFTCRIYTRKEISLIFYFVIHMIERQPNNRLYENIFEVLKRIGISVNEPLNSNNETLLHLNIHQGDLCLFKSLLHHGASLTTKTIEGKTPIDYLSKYNQNKMHEYLILFQKTQPDFREPSIAETNESESDSRSINVPHGL